MVRPAALLPGRLVQVRGSTRSELSRSCRGDTDATGLIRPDTTSISAISGGCVWLCAMQAPLLSAIVKSQRSEEHTSELQALMRNTYAVYCFNKKKQYVSYLDKARTH